MTKNTKKTEKYTEILKLAEMLENEQIPFLIRNVLDGYQIWYTGKYNVGTDLACSAIEHNYSYGAEEDLIEIMGLLTPEEEGDSVLGHLTAEDVFNRIYRHWISTH